MQVAVGAVSVAMVDDFGVFADAMGELLADSDEFTVVGVGRSAADALRIARSKRPQVMVLDYHLPEGAADETIRTIKRRAPATRVIVLTSDTSVRVRDRAIAAGAIDVLTKDRAISEIMGAVKRAAE